MQKQQPIALLSFVASIVFGIVSYMSMELLQNVSTIREPEELVNIVLVCLIFDTAVLGGSALGFLLVSLEALKHKKCGMDNV